MCKYGLLYLVASAIAVLRVQLRFVDCINKRKKEGLRRPISDTSRMQSRNGHRSRKVRRRMHGHGVLRRSQ